MNSNAMGQKQDAPGKKKVVEDVAKSKKDKKKAQIQNALFAGIRQNEQDDSDSSDDAAQKQPNDNNNTQASTPVQPQADLMNLLDMGQPAAPMQQ